MERRCIGTGSSRRKLATSSRVLLILSGGSGDFLLECVIPRVSIVLRAWIMMGSGIVPEWSCRVMSLCLCAPISMCPDFSADTGKLFSPVYCIQMLVISVWSVWYVPTDRKSSANASTGPGMVGGFLSGWCFAR